MRRRVTFVTIAGLAALPLATLFQTSPSEAGGSVGILVLKEHGVGSAAQAQPFVDKLVGVAKEKNGWSDAKGSYFTERKAAETFVDASKPQFGLMSLSAFLAMKDARKLETIGTADVKGAGGQQYFIVSKSASDLAGCKGQKLATDLADDTKFVDRVASGGAFKLADFTVEATKRPLQAPKMVLKDEAKCALVDDAVFAEIAKMEGGSAVKAVWTGAKLPPMAVVAFPSADKATKDAFKASLSELCSGSGKSACGEIGIQALKPADDQAFAQVLAAYKKDK